MNVSADRSEVDPAWTARTTRGVAARYLFSEQLNNLREQAVRWQACPDDHTLHQYRNSLRRCRVLLRVFGVDADAHGGKSLRLALTRVADKLGAVRDLDVMRLVIEKSSYHRCGRNDAELAPLLKKIDQRQDVLQRRVRAYLAGNASGRLTELSRRFLERWIPGDVPPKTEQTIKSFMDREFRRHCRLITEAEEMTASDDSETMHAFRIKLRKLRYLGVLLAELADAGQKRVFKRVHTCEKDLGKLHDMDMTLAFMHAHPFSSPVQLVRELQARRHEKLKSFREKWHKCRKLVRERARITAKA